MERGKLHRIQAICKKLGSVTGVLPILFEVGQYNKPDSSNNIDICGSLVMRTNMRKGDE